MIRLLSICMLFLLCSATSLPAQDLSVLLQKKEMAHPAILWTAQKEAVVKQLIASDSLYGKVHRAILDECNRMLSQPPVQRVLIGKRLLDKSRTALQRIFFLSYAYRITSDARYLKRAEQEMLAVSAFSDWNPSHFLDVAEMSMGVAIGYDWLYDALPESSKGVIREALYQKGVALALNRSTNNWSRVENNWNQVCNAGMAFGALALYNHYPEACREVITLAVKTLPLAMAEYAPDGAYPEGYGYWDYGTSFNVLLIDALEAQFGSDFGLAALPGFLPTSGYMLHMVTPAGRCFSYSDNGLNGTLSPAMFWFARKLNNPSLLWSEKAFLAKLSPASMGRNRIMPALLLWAGDISLQAIPKPEALVWKGNGKSPVVMVRSSWTSNDALFLGVKGGSPSVNHAHMDVGSFVFESEGERWVTDLGSQDYNSLESKGLNIWSRTQDSDRWKVFRYHNLVHSTLSFNRQLQKMAATAGLELDDSDPNCTVISVNLSPLYEGQADSVYRTFFVVDNRFVVITDYLKGGSTDQTVRFSLPTPAGVEETKGGALLLTREGKSRVVFSCSSDRGRGVEPIRAFTERADPPNSWDAPNPGIMLTGYEMGLPAGSERTVSVAICSPDDRKEAERFMKRANRLVRH